MFTVGYGDVLPKNVPEIIMIILIQIFGISYVTQVSFLSDILSVKLDILWPLFVKLNNNLSTTFKIQIKFVSIINWEKISNKEYEIISLIINWLTKN